MRVGALTLVEARTLLGRDPETFVLALVSASGAIAVFRPVLVVPAPLAVRHLVASPLAYPWERLAYPWERYLGDRH